MRKKVREVFDFSRSSEAVLTLVLELIVGLGVVLGSLFIFLRLAERVLGKEVIFFDSSITNFIISFRAPVFTDVMIFISFLGGTYFLTLAIILTILFLWRKHKKDAVMFSFIFFSGIGLNLLLKEIFQRPRPLEPLIHQLEYSFPSGHAMNSFVFYGALTYFVFWHMKNKKLGLLFSVLAGLLVLAIGISRVYLGVHFPSDVLAGFLAGLCWMGIVILVEKTLLFFRLFRKFEIERKY